MLLNHLCIRLNLIFIVFSPKLSTVSVDKKLCYFYQMNQHNNWQSFIDYETKQSYFSDIKNRLISDNKKGRTILPDAKNYFKI